MLSWGVILRALRFSSAVLTSLSLVSSGYLVLHLSLSLSIYLSLSPSTFLLVLFLVLFLASAICRRRLLDLFHGFRVFLSLLGGRGGGGLVRLDRVRVFDDGGRHDVPSGHAPHEARKGGHLSHQRRQRTTKQTRRYGIVVSTQLTHALCSPIHVSRLQYLARVRFVWWRRETL